MTDLEELWQQFLRDADELTKEELVPQLVQQVLRLSYELTSEDLRFLAEKVKHYNDMKKLVREEMDELRAADDEIKKEALAEEASRQPDGAYKDTPEQLFKDAVEEEINEYREFDADDEKINKLREYYREMLKEQSEATDQSMETLVSVTKLINEMRAASAEAADKEASGQGDEAADQRIEDQRDAAAQEFARAAVSQQVSVGSQTTGGAGAQKAAEDGAYKVTPEQLYNAAPELADKEASLGELRKAADEQTNEDEESMDEIAKEYREAYDQSRESMARAIKMIDETSEARQAGQQYGAFSEAADKEASGQGDEAGNILGVPPPYFDELPTLADEEPAPPEPGLDSYFDELPKNLVDEEPGLVPPVPDPEPMQTLNPALLDPTAPGPTLDHGLVERIEQNPQLVDALNQNQDVARALERDPTSIDQIEQDLGFAEPSSVTGSAGVTGELFTDPSLTEPAPPEPTTTPGQDLDDTLNL